MDLDDAIRELRRRNEALPRPLRLPTEAEVVEAERRLAHAFHPDFRRYLREASDVTCGILEPVTITRPESHTDLFKVAASAWDAYHVPRDLLPICEFNADFYCLTPAGEVVFWSHNGWPSSRYPDLSRSAVVFSRPAHCMPNPSEARNGPAQAQWVAAPPPAAPVKVNPGRAPLPTHLGDPGA
jgi:hypothetical protein